MLHNIPPPDKKETERATVRYSLSWTTKRWLTNSSKAGAQENTQPSWRTLYGISPSSPTSPSSNSSGPPFLLPPSRLCRFCFTSPSDSDSCPCCTPQPQPHHLRCSTAHHLTTPTILPRSSTQHAPTQPIMHALHTTLHLRFPTQITYHTPMLLPYTHTIPPTSSTATSS